MLRAALPLKGCWAAVHPSGDSSFRRSAPHERTRERAEKEAGATKGAGVGFDDRLQSSAKALALSPLKAAKRLADVLAGIGLESSFETHDSRFSRL